MHDVCDILHRPSRRPGKVLCPDDNHGVWTERDAADARPFQPVRIPRSGIDRVVRAGCVRARDDGIESSIKYLLLSAVATSMILLGIALIYMNTGTLEFDA